MAVTRSWCDCQTGLAVNRPSSAVGRCLVTDQGLCTCRCLSDLVTVSVLSGLGLGFGGLVDVTDLGHRMGQEQ